MNSASARLRALRATINALNASNPNNNTHWEPWRRQQCSLCIDRGCRHRRPNLYENAYINWVCLLVVCLFLCVSCLHACVLSSSASLPLSDTCPHGSISPSDGGSRRYAQKIEVDSWVQKDWACSLPSRSQMLKESVDYIVGTHCQVVIHENAAEG